jgi:hypothetical protein
MATPTVCSGDFGQRKYQTNNALISLSVIPAYAGIQSAAEKLDTRFRGYDEPGNDRAICGSSFQEIWPRRLLP